MLKKKIVYFTVVLSLIFMPLSATSLDMKGVSDNKAATLAFSQWARGLGYKVIKVLDSGQSVVLDAGDDINSIVQLKVGSDNADKVVFQIIFGSNSGTSNLSDKMKLANTINNELNSCKVSVTTNGGWEFEYVLYFDEQLSPALFRHMMEHIKSSNRLILNRYAAQFQSFEK